MFSSLKRYFGVGKKIFVLAGVCTLIVAIFMHVFQSNKLKLQSPSQTQNTREKYYALMANVEKDKTKETQVALGIFKKTYCVAIGELCDNQTAKEDSRKGLLTLMTENMFLPLTKPPASAIGWARESLGEAGFIPKTYAAQGVGFGAMKPFSNLWKVFRDLSYMLLVLVLVAIGFMIMLRMKLNPQTVISVENALPRIVVSLVLITFSFAIAGFLIDLMYVVIALLISLMSNNDTYYNATVQQNFYLNGGGWTIFQSMFPAKSTSFWSLTDNLTLMGNSILAMLGTGLNSVIRLVGGTAFGFYIAKNGLPITNALIHMLNGISIGTLSLGELPSLPMALIVYPIIFFAASGFGTFYLPQLIVGLLLLFTMVFLTFRIFFMLLKSYIQILLLVIFAPIILIFEAVPGKNSFSFWFKTLFVELLTFPITIAIFLLGYIIINTLPASGEKLWSPPLTAGIDPAAFSILIGMTLLFTLPDLVKAARGFLGVKEGLPIGLNVGTFFGGATTTVGGAMGLVGGYGSLSLAMPGLKNAAKGITKGTPLETLFKE